VADESGREDQQFERYLLGLLPEDEAERLDELSLTDDEAAWRLSAVENDLVDAYVRGELSGETLQRFNSYYLLSPIRRAKVTFAQTWLLANPAAAEAESPAPAAATPTTTASAGAAASATRIADSTTKTAQSAATSATASAAAAGAAAGATTGVKTGAAGSTSSRAGWIDRLFPGRTAPWSVFVAVAAVLLVICGVLFIQDVRMRQAVMRAETDRAALEQRAQELQRQLEAARAANASTAAELTRLRASGGSGTSDPTLIAGGPVAGGSRPDDQTTGSSSSAPTAIALMLWPRTRSGGANATLAVPPGADRVAIDLRIEANDFPRYEAVLKDLATNQVVWRSSRLAAKAAADHTSVIVTIPAGTLNRGRYALDLTGLPANGNGELISSYPFQVVGR
jgi:hypothetical protein